MFLNGFYMCRSTLPVLALTVDILASQTLNDLKSKFHCENDFVYICPIKHPKDVKKMDWKKFAGVHDVSINVQCSKQNWVRDLNEHASFEVRLCKILLIFVFRMLQLVLLPYA